MIGVYQCGRKWQDRHYSWNFGHTMAIVHIWAYDGILASGVASPVDVLSAANQFHARKAAPGTTSTPVFAWRVESLDGFVRIPATLETYESIVNKELKFERSGADND